MTAGAGRWRVLVVDDCAAARRSLGRMIGREDDLELVDAAHDGEQALRSVARSALHGRPVHVVLLDVDMPSLDGLATLPRLLAIEPRLALDGGSDGLDAYRRLGPAAMRLLVPGGLAAFEIGNGQADSVHRIMAAAGLRHIATARDLAAVERCVLFRKS